MKKIMALMTAALLSASMVSSCGKAGTSGHNWENSYLTKALLHGTYY